MKILPVILAGGTGTRLWPLSRAAYPKQFLNLIGDGSLLQQTALRARAISDEMPLIIGLEAHRFIIADQLAEIDSPDAELILEPEGKNTAMAVALAALSTDPETVLLILPADHYIPDHTAFAIAAKQAAALAEQGYLTTFGMTPNQPATGYGYIQAGDMLMPHGHQVTRFHEKPDQSTAMQYLASGGWYWNSGMFAFKAETVLQALQQHAPDVFRAAQTAWQLKNTQKHVSQISAATYAGAPNISIDYALMEHTRHAAVLPVQFAWSDVGQWHSLHELTQAGDINANTLQGSVTAVDSANCQLRSIGPHIAAVGIKDLTVIATHDTVLVMPHTVGASWGALRQELQNAAPELLQAQRQHHRPWGTYEVIHQGQDFLVKEIVVKPGQRLSLQRHKHRSEHWVVVQGFCRVTCDDWVKDLGPNMSSYIPMGSVHRMENIGPSELHLIEVQCGSHISEDDIERLQDDFGRTPAEAK